MTARWGVLVTGAIAAAAAVVLVASAGAGAHPAKAAASVSCAPNTDLTIKSGPICGLTVNSTHEWLGIPYAAPPVGQLRWQPPAPPAPWTTTLQATSFGSECTQSFGPGAALQGSENCLFINVWAPAAASASAHLPVLVHIHGGGFVFGNGNGNNTLLSSRGNEVVVSFNYRLGIFGFLADSALGPHSGDYGLQDQQAALAWVQANIATFGGDPGNVTIFGESAGGSSVCDQIASPTARGLFQRGISVSGEYNTLLGAPNSLQQQDCKAPLPTQAQSQAAGANFAAAVGCTTNVAACLRGLPAATAQAAAGGNGSAGVFFPAGFQDGGLGTVAPTINGLTLTRTLRQALAAGTANRVDVIAGTDRDENLVGSASTPAQYTSVIDSQFGQFAPQVLRLYPVSLFDSPDVAIRTVEADSGTVCPSIETARDLARRMPAREYEIDDNDLPPYSPPGANSPAQGASHVGAWYVTPQASPLDANQQVLQDQELAFVTAFARDGSPDAAGLPAWPALGPHGGQVMSLQPAGDSELVSTSQLAAEHNCGFWDQVANSTL